MAPRAGARGRQRAAAAAPAPQTDGAPPPPVAKIGHNGIQMTDDELLAYIARHDQANHAIETATAALKAANKAKNNLRQLIKGRGIKLKNLDAALEKRQLNRAEQREDIDQQAHIDSVLGNVTWDEATLFDQQEDDTVKDAADWEGAGYTLGLKLAKMDVALLEEHRVPPMFHQDFMRGHDRGVERMMHAIKTGNVGEGPAPGAEPPPNPIGAQAAADFAADNPDVDTTGGEPVDESDPDQDEATGVDEGAGGDDASDDDTETTVFDTEAETEEA